MAPLLFLAATPAAQQPPAPPPGGEEPNRLPDGRLWSEAVIKANYEANINDLERMRQILDNVRKEFERTRGHVLSIRALKELDELERLSKRVGDRMRRH